MPSHSSCMSGLGGGDRHLVGMKLPIHDDGFADLFCLVQPPNLGVSDEPQGQGEQADASNATAVPPELGPWSSRDHSLSLAVNPPPGDQLTTGSSSTSYHEELLKNDSETCGWTDGREYHHLWKKNCALTILADQNTLKNDLELSNFGLSSNCWSNQMPLSQTPSSQSPHLHSPNLHPGDMDWSEYIHMPQENENTLLLENHAPPMPIHDKYADTETVISPPISQRSPATASAPDQQLPVGVVAASLQVPSTSIIPKPSSTHKRQRFQAIATPQLRPKFAHTLPKSTGSGRYASKEQRVKESEHLYIAISSHICRSVPSPRPDLQHKPEHTSGRVCKRSSKTNEESLHKRRNYQRIAEQSRRLRLNSALKQLEALLPPTLDQEKSQLTCQTHNATVKTQKKTANSMDQTKACVMELAVEYIKMLRATLNEKSLRMSELGMTSPGILM